MYYLSKGEELTPQMILKYIDDYKVNFLPKLLRNKRYYDCKNDSIMNRKFEDTTKPNNKHATSWSRYITTVISGYFLGKPVSYGTQQEKLKEIISANTTKEISHNQLLEKDCSIYGLACELLYVDEDKKVKFEKINPCGVILIYSNSIDKELLYGIRFWDNKDIITSKNATHIEVYSSEYIKCYVLNGTDIREESSNLHIFKSVPINVYYNNDDVTGDSECVQSLIDAYDLALSDTSNYREELNDSYLVFKNTNLETNDIITMKSKRVIQIEDAENGMQSDVRWLNKDSNDTENENYKNRLSEDIKRFSFVADIECGKSHTTATSAKIGLLGIEQICVNKESWFRIGLLRRLQLICNVINVKDENLSVDDVSITFVRNVPIDLTVISDAIVKLMPLVPKQLLLEQLPFIADVAKAMELKAEEDKLDPYNDSIFSDDLGSDDTSTVEGVVND